jgi:threonine aldolase
MIDVRSDTVTQPTEAMRAAMHAAQLGDDVFGEDPTVNELQQRAATMFGMESALFCPTGTMTNQIAIKVHTQPADEIVCDRLAHIYLYEGGGTAFHSGCSVRLLEGDRGRFSATDVSANINARHDAHHPWTRLVAIENTVNKGGGACWQLPEIEKIQAVCRANGLGLHLDGARLFNAIVATQVKPAVFGQLFDSISICLSKGLGAPVGSLLLGRREFIQKAHRVRKVMGGGMRQAGVIAAAGLYALEHHIERLSQDHARAKHLGTTLARLPYVKHVLPVETNIVIFELTEACDGEAYLKALQAAGVRAVRMGPRLIRFVTHLNISDADTEHLVDIVSRYKP